MLVLRSVIFKAQKKTKTDLSLIFFQLKFLIQVVIFWMIRPKPNIELYFIKEKSKELELLANVWYSLPFKFREGKFFILVMMKSLLNVLCMHFKKKIKSAIWKSKNHCPRINYSTIKVWQIVKECQFRYGKL